MGGVDPDAYYAARDRLDRAGRAVQAAIGQLDAALDEAGAAIRAGAEAGVTWSDMATLTGIERSKGIPRALAGERPRIRATERSPKPSS